MSMTTVLPPTVTMPNIRPCSARTMITINMDVATIYPPKNKTKKKYVATYRGLRAMASRRYPAKGRMVRAATV